MSRFSPAHDADVKEELRTTKREPLVLDPPWAAWVLAIYPLFMLVGAVLTTVEQGFRAGLKELSPVILWAWMLANLAGVRWTSRLKGWIGFGAACLLVLVAHVASWWR